MNDPSLPMSLVAMESHWGVVNVAMLDKDSRFERELVRVMVATAGAGVSQYKASYMQTVSSPEDLDKLVGNGHTVDATTSMLNNLQNLGVTRTRMTTYRKACHEGWDPAPTNDYQRVIWKEVHELFILSLTESGRADEMPEMMKLFEDRVAKMYGPEIAAGILQGDSELNAKYGSIRSIYRGSKFAWWLADPSTHSLARDMIREIEAQPHLDNDVTWNYMKWKYYKAVGNAKKADSLYEKLIKGERRFGYTQFRFIRKNEEAEGSSR